MLNRVISFLCGEVELETAAEHRERLVSIIAEQSVEAKISYDRESGGVKVHTAPASAKKIARALDKTDIIVYINSVCGLKASLLSRCKRIGLLIGLCIFFSLLFASTLFVFKVEIKGSDKIAAETIRSELDDFGIRVGARLSDIDRNAVSGRFLQLHPELSWAAINFKGTTVCLELKEKSEGQSSEAQKQELLVAGCDGVIKNVLVYSGKSVVLQGAVVKKGDLLISGYISGNGLQYTDNPILRFEGASGVVMAQVSDSITVTVPKNDKTQITEKTGEKSRIYSFLGFEVGKNRVAGDFITLPEKSLTVLGVIELPITYREFCGVKTKELSTSISEKEALEIAKKQALDELNKRLSSGELLQMEITEEINENGVTVTVSYTCIVDIAVPRTEE